MEHLDNVQINEYETDLYFIKLSQHMATDCLLIYGFLPVLSCCDLKIVLQIFTIKTKTILWSWLT